MGRPVVRGFVCSTEMHRARKRVLIDGETLADLMIDDDVGVTVAETYLLKRLGNDFFEMLARRGRRPSAASCLERRTAASCLAIGSSPATSPAPPASSRQMRGRPGNGRQTMPGGGPRTAAHYRDLEPHHKRDEEQHPAAGAGAAGRAAPPGPHPPAAGGVGGDSRLAQEDCPGDRPAICLPFLSIWPTN